MLPQPWNKNGKVYGKLIQEKYVNGREKKPRSWGILPYLGMISEEVVGRTLKKRRQKLFLEKEAHCKTLSAKKQAKYRLMCGIC